MKMRWRSNITKLFSLLNCLIVWQQMKYCRSLNTFFLKRGSRSYWVDASLWPSGSCLCAGLVKGQQVRDIKPPNKDRNRTHMSIARRPRGSGQNHCAASDAKMRTINLLSHHRAYIMIHHSILPVLGLSQWTQNICIPFVQCWTNVEDVGPTLYKCYTNVLCLLR